MDELILGHGLGRVVDVKAMGLESLDGLLADVFEEQKTQVFVVHGVEDLGLANSKADGHGVFSSGEEVVQGGGRGGGGDRDGGGGLGGTGGDGDGRGHYFGVFMCVQKRVLVEEGTDAASEKATDAIK